METLSLDTTASWEFVSLSRHFAPSPLQLLQAVPGRWVGWASGRARGLGLDSWEPQLDREHACFLPSCRFCVTAGHCALLLDRLLVDSVSRVSLATLHCCAASVSNTCDGSALYGQHHASRGSVGRSLAPAYFKGTQTSHLINRRFPAVVPRLRRAVHVRIVSLHAIGRHFSSPGLRV